MNNESKIVPKGTAVSVGGQRPTLNFVDFAGLVTKVSVSTKGNPKTLANSGYYIGLEVKQGESIQRYGLMSNALIGSTFAGKQVGLNDKLDLYQLEGKVVEYDGNIVTNIRLPLPEEQEQQPQAEQEPAW